MGTGARVMPAGAGRLCCVRSTGRDGGVRTVLGVAAWVSGVGFSVLVGCERNLSKIECDSSGLVVSGALFFIPNRDRALSIIDGFGGVGAGVAGCFVCAAGAAAGRLTWSAGVV